MNRVTLFAVCLCTLLTAFAAADPVVIAHRGASGYLPEHTLESYAFAYAAGADYIEQDLALTKDGRLVCMHDICLELTTDVEEQYPDRKREDGRWYVIDFTLDEIKGLHVHERLPRRFPVKKSDFEVPTFEEAIELVQGLNASTHRNVGIYPEMKEPGWHTKEGQPIEEPCAAVLRAYGYTDQNARVFVQCFEEGPLRKMRTEIGLDVPQIYLFGNDKSQDHLATPEGLAKIKEFAEGIGPDKARIEADPELVERAHAAGLLVHPYTLRADMRPRKYPTPEDEARQFFFTYKVDGMFTDFADIAVAVIRAGQPK